MPGWYVHMDAAREAITNLDTNANATIIFSRESGPSAADLQAIAKAHPTYYALGAIGPDIFFLLPDFKPPVGTGLWGAANLIRTLYTWWDENFLGPYEAALGPIAKNNADTINSLSGGLTQQLSDIFSQAIAFLIDFVVVLITKQYDIFGLLSSGVPQGYDEQSFFWSDMLHYRKTNEFAHHLWTSAATDEQRAFAMGWMTHVATDVTGHCFVNEKCGGPYRLHWQRHHLVENHIDGKVYDSEHGSQSMYNMLSNSALHLWLAFNPDGSSRENFLNFPQPGPSYDTGDDTPAILDRKSKWDVDSGIPAGLAGFIADALKAVYNPATASTSVDACAPAPSIINAIQTGRTDGFATADDISGTYWWLYHYVKWTTTDYYSIRRPTPPDVFIVQPFPSPPGSGSSDPGPGGSSDDSAWQDFLSFLLDLLAWLTYIAQVLAYPVAVLTGLIASFGTYPLRYALYELLELPLYNAWQSLHWYLAMTGFTYPMQGEVNAGLMTLGTTVVDTWAVTHASLNDFSGGLGGTPAASSEPSGHSNDQRYPRDVVEDPANAVTAAVNAILKKTCGGTTTAPSEFMRPWRYPETNNAGSAVPFEGPDTTASPYTAPHDATILMGGSPGNNDARSRFEGARSEAETIALGRDLIRAGQHLGDPVDYSSYLIASLTRESAGTPTHPIANFNLDSDRGYAYLCWDWLRSKDVIGVPTPYFRDPSYGGPNDLAGHRAYHAPVAPGAGWCADDIGPPSPAGGVASNQNAVPTMHDEQKENPVRIRYIDIEEKFV